jgi:hypothetical protein
MLVISPMEGWKWMQ